MLNGLAWILIVILSMVINGCLAGFVAKEKGYKRGSWFVIGFFFSLFGLIAASGLPVSQTRQASQAAQRTQDESLRF